jgi:glycosyltransferase involved in cell wall biosynthesis
VYSCAVLVVSSDKYQDLWRPFFSLFRQYWPDCPFPVYLGSQRAAGEFENVRMLQSTDPTWSGSLRSFLSQLDCLNVLLLLEDFFLSEKVPTEKVLEQLAALRQMGGNVLRLYPNPAPTIKLAAQPGIGEQHRLVPFRVSLQASIWDRNALLSLLRDGESPWEFEINGTIRAQAQPRGFYCTFKKTFPYQHVVEKGEWFWSAANYYRNLKIGCDFNTRPVMGPVTALRKTVMMNWRQWRARFLTMPLRSRELDPYATTPRNALRVAFLTNLIPPYHKRVLQLLAHKYQALRVLLSTPMESNRPWKVDWSDLDVVVQRTRTTKGLWRHPRGFSEELAVHVPLDTLQQLQRFTPDVIISAEMGARTLLATVFRKLNPATRLIIWAEAAESTESGRGWARQIARRIFVRQADAFLAVGSSAVKYLEGIGAPAGKIFKIAYTTDIEQFAANALTRPRARARRLLYCGQFVERKGLVPFLTILSQWATRHPTCHVEIALAGDGPLRDTLSELPLAANVKLEFLGVFQYDDLPEIYGSAGVFVLPTLADTWAVVVNEALVAGLPVLGSVYAQAVEELIQEGRNGWIFTPDNAEDTYQAIDRMMNTSDEELDAMRVRGRATALQLTPERVAEFIDRAVDYCVER